MYVSFQVLFIINDYWLIHRIPVSFSGASTYNKLSRLMMLWCCTHNSLVQCNNSYMIPEYDALYDLKRQWYYEFLPFLSNQPGIDKLILGGDVARRYVHQTFGWKNMHSILVPGFSFIQTAIVLEHRSKIVWKCIIWELVPKYHTLDIKYIGNFQ